MYVGIDWGTKSHRVCIVDEAGNRVNQFPMSAILVKILNFWQTLATCFVSPKIHSRVLVGIETKHGAVVEGLVLHGFSVYSINPKQKRTIS